MKFDQRFQVFGSRELDQAIAWSADAGIAIHLHQVINYATAPKVFASAVRGGQPIAHLFCADRVVLVAVVKRLGIRVIRVERSETPKQHVDLCCAPLRRALAKCGDQDRVRAALEQFGARP